MSFWRHPNAPAELVAQDVWPQKRARSYRDGIYIVWCLDLLPPCHRLFPLLPVCFWGVVEERKRVDVVEDGSGSAYAIKRYATTYFLLSLLAPLLSDCLSLRCCLSGPQQWLRHEVNMLSRANHAHIVQVLAARELENGGCELVCLCFACIHAVCSSVFFVIYPADAKAQACS